MYGEEQMNNIETFSSLTREKKEAAVLLSIGTFLEYFDLMLYIHMAVLLNDIFFPQTDPHTTLLISALAFCSSYILRPFGAMIFGYIGDHFGRKITVVITTFIMAFACFVMAIVPIYAKIGILSAWIVTICRALQGLASMGELTGAQLYVAEIMKPPARYVGVSLMVVCSTLGTVFALFVAYIVTVFEVNWRFAFLFGAIVAVVGSFARTGLRETPEFADAKRRIKVITDKSEVNIDLSHNNIYLKKIKLKTIVAIVLCNLVGPVSSYFSYIYCGTILKTCFGFTAAEVIKENFFISMIKLLFMIFIVYLSYKIHPIKIAKKLLYCFMFVVTITPALMIFNNNSDNLFLTRFLIVTTETSFLMAPIKFMHIPVFKRFTCISLSFAFSHIVGYVVSSFSLVYMMEYFNYWGLTVMILPIAIGYMWAILYFEKLEKESGNFLPNQNDEAYCSV
jgi:MFS transporter, MHS family, proline/betaine transporter